MRRLTLSVVVAGIGLAFGPAAYAQTTCFTDAFTYTPDGDLNGQHPPISTFPCLASVCSGGPSNGNACSTDADCSVKWTGGAGKVHVASNQVKLDFSEQVIGTNSSSSFALASPCTDCAITASILIKRGADTGPNANRGDLGFQWRVSFTGLNGATTVNLGGFDGTGLTARGRIGEGTVGGSVTLSDTTFTKLTAVIFPPPTKQTKFYKDNDTTPFFSSGWPSGVGNAPAVTGMYIQLNSNSTSFTCTSNLCSGGVHAGEACSANGDCRVTTGLMYFDDFSVVSGPCSCLTSLDPPPNDLITNFLAVAEAGGAQAFPLSLDFTLSNLSTSSPVNYTASEVKADGTTATNYSWLSLSPANGSVGIQSDSVPPISAQFTPIPATPGIYSGSIRIADDCSPANGHVRPVILTVGSAPCVVEPFQYTSGNLVDANPFVIKSGGWASAGAGNVNLIQVIADPANADNQVTQIALSTETDAISAVLGGLDCGPCEDSTIAVVAKVKRSAVGSSGDGSTGAWVLDFGDSSLKSLARWQGNWEATQGRTRGGTLVTASGSLGDGQYHTLMAIIDIKANITTYYFDGTPLGGDNPQIHGADLDDTTNIGDHVGSITLTLQANRTNVSGSVMFDDLQVISCPGVCTGHVSADRSQIGFTDVAHANSGATTATLNDGLTAYGKDYAFQNDGPAPITYSVAKVNADGSPAPAAYPWLQMTAPSGTPLTAGAAEDITLSYNTTGLADGLYRAYIQFADSCSRTYLRAIQLNVGTCILEDFAYPNGSNLESVAGWRSGFLNQQGPVPQQPAGTSNPYPIEVTGGHVVVHGTGPDATIEATHEFINNCTDCPDTDLITPDLQGDGLIVVKLRIRGTDLPTASSRYWTIAFTNNSGTPIASWEGAAEFVEAAGDGGLNSGLTDGIYHELKAHINPNSTAIEGIPANTTRYFFDGTVKGDVSHVNTGLDRVRLIRIRRTGNASTDGDISHPPLIEIDDISVSECQPICGDPVFDVRDSGNAVARDTYVDDHDLNFGFEPCMGPVVDGAHGHGGAVPNLTLSKECKCMDLDHNDIIDMADFARFQRCYSGSSTPADTGCDD